MDTNLEAFSDLTSTDDARQSAEESNAIPVPAKPTAAMLAEGARAGGVSVSVAFRVYQAMIGYPSR